MVDDKSNKGPYAMKTPKIKTEQDVAKDSAKIIAKEYKLGENEIQGLKDFREQIKKKGIKLNLEEIVNKIKQFPTTKITEMYLGITLSMEIEGLKGKKDKLDLLEKKRKEYEIGTFCYFNSVTVMKIKGEWKEEKKK